MSNESNVRELAALLGKATTELTNEGHSGDYQRLARALSDRGVLTVSADRPHIEDPAKRKAVAAFVRDRLTRIAEGLT
jgi:hypothetical protein